MSEAPRPTSVAPPADRAKRAAAPHPALLARRRRVRSLRRRVVAVTVALFVAVWGVIGVRLVEGHDPQLSSGASKAVVTAPLAASAKATSSTSATSSTNATSSTAGTSTAGTVASVDTSTSTPTPAAATTRAS